MKKMLLAFGTLFVAGILLWAESPSLDGRALVADPGLFPRGLFAKTVGYLPGDSISVTNPANGERVDILVIGSLDPSEGVAVLLSPEAAEALNIKKNANNLVKLTKRSGGADEVCNGSAVLTNSGYCPPEEEAPAEEKTIEQVVEEAIESGVPVEEAVAEAVEKAEEAVADKAFDQAEEELAEAEAEADETVEEIPEEGTEEVAQEEGEYPQYEEPVVDELAQNDETEAEDDFVEAEVKDEPIDVVEDESGEEIVVAEEITEEEPLDEYEAIVLVPSESKAPEAVESEEPVVEFEPEPLQKSAGVSYLSGYGELEGQKYYVQIASCNKTETVDQLTAQYAGRYPITVIQNAGRSPVLVGPLTVDEYGVVLERFKSYGFKDAFVKVGTGAAPRSYDNER